jgi:hypothetical protein
MLALPIGRNEGQVTQANSDEVQHAKQQRERGTIGIMSQVKFNFKGVNSKDGRTIAPQRRALHGGRRTLSSILITIKYIKQNMVHGCGKSIINIKFKSHLTAEMGEQNRIRMKSNFVARPRVNTQLYVHSSASNQAAQANVLY